MAIFYIMKIERSCFELGFGLVYSAAHMIREREEEGKEKYNFLASSVFISLCILVTNFLTYSFHVISFW